MVMPTAIKDDEGRVLFSIKELGQHGTMEGRLAPGFAGKLKELRLRFGLPMQVNSCCRSAAYNASIGGHPHSLHVYDDPYHPTGGTCAIDIKTSHREPEYRQALEDLALQLGWSVGEYDNFLHLDRRSDYTDRPQTVFFG